MENLTSTNPLDHTANVKKEFSMLISHLREDIAKFDDMSAKAIFEVSAEVITSLQKAFTDYELKNEPAWKTS